MKKRIKKLTALFLALSMTLWMSGGAYASEVSMDDIPDMTVSEDVIPEEAEAEETGVTADSTEENGVTAAMKVSAKIKEKAAELRSFSADVDYVNGEGVVLAETKEEAEKIAAEYGGTLKRYAEGIATIDFGRNTVDALNETADKMTATIVVEPNFIRHIDGVRPDNEEKQDQSYNVLSIENSQDWKDANDNGTEMSITATAAPNDPWYAESSKCYQWFHNKIKTLEAHELATGKGVRVAVIDSGINTTGTDFNTDTEVHYVASMSDGVDRNGHGSNCAGIIGAVKNNNLHGFGVASDSTIDSIKGLDDKGSGSDADIMEAMKMAAKNKANVISMSLGGPGSSDSFQEVCTDIAEEGITIIAAAGNESTDEISYPAGYENVIAVASAEKDDTLSDFSNYGDWVDIVACGGRYIFSEPPVGEEYTGYAGTSQATPQVAAAAALMYEVNPEFKKDTSIDTPNAIREILLSTTDEKEYKYKDHVVTGLLQVDAAVEMAKDYSGSAGSSYTIVDPAGWYGRRLSGRICQGGSLKLAVGDASGNVKAAKSVAKTAVWASDNPSVLAVKKGKVKCSKTAAIGTKVKVTATIGTSVVTYNFTVSYKPKMFGVCHTSIKKNGHKYKYVYKFKSNMIGNGRAGVEYTLTNPYYLTGGEARLMWDINKKTGFYWYYAANSNYRYDITIPKGQQKKMTVENGKNGKPVHIKINSPGKYTIKYKVLDGSNKTFKLIIKV